MPVGPFPSWCRDYLCFDCDSFVTATRVKNGFCGDLADLAEILNRPKRWRFLLVEGLGEIERVTLWGAVLSVWDEIHVFSDTSVIGGLFNKSVGGNCPEFVSFSRSKLHPSTALNIISYTPVLLTEVNTLSGRSISWWRCLERGFPRSDQVRLLNGSPLCSVILDTFFNHTTSCTPMDTALGQQRRGIDIAIS